jgi:gentisate 1,2-dioxygenase
VGQADSRSGTAAGLSLTDERELFSREAAAKNLKPLWERTIRLQPGGAAIPAIWRYADVRAALLRAAELITAREAERRVLMLENPGLPGTTFIGTALFAGMQLIRPREVAAAHRHSPNALRFIVEGDGAYTTLDGERVRMRPGDFVVTPGWTWHDHGNLGSEPVIWMDGLDLPFAQIFGAHFREDYADETQAVATSAAGSAGRQTRIYSYPIMRQQLERLACSGPPDPSHGFRLRYADADRRDLLPTVAAFLQWLPAGFAGERYCSTECKVFNVVEGRGETNIGDSRFDFLPHDIFVVPPWTPYSIVADAECVLFSYSDRAAQEALGFYRESLATALT